MIGALSVGEYLSAIGCGLLVALLLCWVMAKLGWPG